jgi:hypothetical protein
MFLGQTGIGNFTVQDRNLSTAGMLLGSPTEQSEQWT